MPPLQPGDEQHLEREQRRQRPGKEGAVDAPPGERADQGRSPGADGREVPPWRWGEVDVGGGLPLLDDPELFAGRDTFHNGKPIEYFPYWQVFRSPYGLSAWPSTPPESARVVAGAAGIGYRQEWRTARVCWPW